MQTGEDFFTLCSKSVLEMSTLTYGPAFSVLFHPLSVITKKFNQFQQEYINAKSEPAQREVLSQQLTFLRGDEPEKPVYRNVTQQLGPIGETEDRLLKIKPDWCAEYVEPQYTGQELAKYRTILGGMAEDERIEYL